MPASNADSAAQTWSIDSLRACARRGAVSVAQLVARHEEAKRRSAEATAADGSQALLDELHEQDNELAAALDELCEQVNALTHATALLERERSKYIDLFMNAPGGLLITDLTGLIQEVNEEAGALFGGAA
ncbi:MAG: hypothetical protein JOZ69_06965, partial [Myxococcales bacterium]|nr:hypothetical protein [Myxococcales bacterium]